MKNNKKELHLFLEKEQYEMLKIEAKKNNKSVSELIREKINLSFINEEKLEKYLNIQMKVISKNIKTELDELKETIFSLQRELILNFTKEISDNQKFIKEALKIIAFYSVYASLFSTLKWQNVNAMGEISWEAVKEKREQWKKEADNIVKKILGEGILDKLGR